MTILNNIKSFSAPLSLAQEASAVILLQILLLNILALLIMSL